MTQEPRSGPTESGRKGRDPDSAPPRIPPDREADRASESGDSGSRGSGPQTPTGTQILSQEEISDALQVPTHKDGTLSPPLADRTSHLGPYELFDKVGEGGMAIVYRARHVELDRIVALKVLRQHLSSETDVARFRREALLAARLEDDHVVRVYDIGAYDGRMCLALQWIDGTTFDRWANALPGGPRRNVEKILRVLLPALRALGRAHEAGIVHRDFKPGNILIDGEARVYLADFGLARPVDNQSNLTRTGEILGTPAYLSPEQARGEVSHVDFRSDVYSVGASLYGVFAGRPPFEAEVLVGLLRMIDTGTRKSLRHHWPELPHQLEIIIDRAMEREPAQRYPSIGEMADDIQRWLDGAPIHARPIGPIERLRRQIRRHRTAFTAGMGGLVALILLGALALSRAQVIGEREALRVKADALAQGARDHHRAGRLREAVEAFDSAHQIAPDRTDLLQEASQVRREILQRVEAGLASARGALDEGLVESAREQLARIEDVARGRKDFQTLWELTRERVGSLLVESPSAAVRIFRIRPGTLELEPEPVAEGPAPLLWNAAPMGGYCVEVTAPGSVSVRIPAAVRAPTESAPEAHHVRLAVPPAPGMGAVRAGMILVRGGPSIQGGGALGALPLRTVTLSSFLIDEVEVTNRAYAEFVRATRAAPPPHWQGAEPPAALLDLPVVNVNWREASAYAAWRGLRLPTEEEWERAGRWVDGRHFPWGNEWEEGRSNSGGGSRRLEPTRSHAQDCSPDRVWDLAGNVSEWTAGEASTPQKTEGRVVRGSAYPMHHQLRLFLLEHLATRKIVEPDVRREYLGFRCAGDLPPD